MTAEAALAVQPLAPLSTSSAGPVAPSTVTAMSSRNASLETPPSVATRKRNWTFWPA